MLQPVEVFPNARRTLRRSVSHLDSEVIARCWDLPRRHRVLDLSEDGMRVASGTRLPRDEHVVLSFTPPGWWLHGELTVFARVVRRTERGSDQPATMGFEFLDVPAGARAELAHTLRGLPPPLPSRQLPRRHEMVWVDVLLTYTEDLGDRVNTIEISERLPRDALERLEPRVVGDLVTGGGRPYRWQL